LGLISTVECGLKSGGRAYQQAPVKPMVKIFKDYHQAEANSIIAHSFGGMALCNAVNRHNLEVNKAVLVASPCTFKYILDSFRSELNITQEVADIMVERIRKRLLEERKVDFYELSVDSFAKTLNFPFLVIHDRDDKVVSYSQGVGYANNLPDVEFVTTEGLGHNRILKDPEIMNKIIEFAIIEFASA